MKVVFDILGGDNAPFATLEASVLALQKHENLEMVLVGDEATIENRFAKLPALRERIEIIHATENISCDEQPTVAIKQRVNSSIVIALNTLKSRDDCGAMLSAGSTGALLTGAFMKLGRIEGVSRPALCPIMPTIIEGKRVMLVDAGANVDCKPINLVHFAIMANVYMKASGVKSPKIALVNVGTEENKGNELTHATSKILREIADASDGGFNFVGNMEARDTFSGEYDIIVADGFVGNVLLKTAEGMASFYGKKVRGALGRGLCAKMGALLLRRNLSKMKKQMSEDANGGSPFLGIKKAVVKSHGNSSVGAFLAAIEVAIRCASADLSTEIKDAIAASAVFTAVT